MNEMKLRFDGRLDYQLDAIESATELFKTQKLNRSSTVLVPEDGVTQNTLT
jgi:hypothetical protein